MKILFLVILLFLKMNSVFSENNILFFIESALKNNPRLNAERENLKAIKQNINISRSEFLPNLTISGSQTSSESSNRTNQSGVSLPDTNINTENETISVDQKIFQGFHGYNTLKKSKLEVEKANFELKDIEQKVIMETVIAYYNLVFKSKNKEFNLANTDLFERQVETDSARLQKGEVNLTDLAQSESSLAGAKAKLIAADTELITAKVDFKKITGAEIPKEINNYLILTTKLPINLKSALEISESNNPKLMIARLDSLIAEKDLYIEKAKLSPKASLNYSKSKIDDFSSTINKNDEETLKATLSWPIISGGKNYSSVKKSIHKKKQSNLLQKNIENEVISSITNAWSVYQSSESVLKATKAQLKAAEIANEGITLEYDSGNSRTTLDVIQSRSLLLEARISHAKAERDFITSKFKLVNQIGNLALDTLKIV